MSNSTTSQDRRPIPEYEGLYEVDQQGNVYALFPFRKESAGRMMAQRIDPAGYVNTTLTKKAHSKRHSIHRLVMLAWRPVENSGKLDVNHIDGNKQNNCLDNLEWATHAENMRHAGTVLNAWEKRNQRGDTSGHHKLTSESVREIRRLRAAGMTQTQLAAMYGVTQVNIGAIVRRKTWTHIE